MHMHMYTCTHTHTHGQTYACTRTHSRACTHTLTSLTVAGAGRRPEEFSPAARPQSLQPEHAAATGWRGHRRGVGHEFIVVLEPHSNVNTAYYLYTTPRLLYSYIVNTRNV